MNAASPVQRVEFRGRAWWIKRDDLLAPLPGNKARKLWWLQQQDWNGIRRVASRGGAQSNAMLALARLAAMHRRPFVYYCQNVPAWLKQTPVGNLRAALALGMELVELARGEVVPRDSGTLFVPQGAAMPEAEAGVAGLAAEITQFAAAQGLDNLQVCLPSGTGTTALYLQKHLSLPVLTVPCVGDADYLRRQWAELSPDPWPRILDAPRYRFGRIYPEFPALWQELRAATGIEFDLLYDPPTWLALLQANPEGPVLYVHCGGVEGNPSLLARYRRAGLIS